MNEWLVIDLQCHARTAQLLGARRERRATARTDAVRIHDEMGQIWAMEIPLNLLEDKSEHKPRTEH